MLKQDVLDCLHSKVRWYAIHQTKKVSFRLNPLLNGTEDLRQAVNDLRYLPDFDQARRLESEVYGENYGRKYPAFIVSDVKEYKFWPFVAGKDWKHASSLRVTPGALLTCLQETLRSLEREGKILKYTTYVHENAQAFKPKTCLKNGNLPMRVLNTPTTTTIQERIRKEGTSIMKISFTYYGISIYHLKEILEKDGIIGVTDEEIAQSNPAYFSNNCRKGKSLKLSEVIEKTHRLHLAAANSLTIDSTRTTLHNINAKRRYTNKRRFTQGQICWMTTHAMEHYGQDLRSTIMNPVNRRIVLEKKREQQMSNKRRGEMYESLKKAIRESHRPYERWWLRQLGDPFMSCLNSIAHTQETYFGDTWIVDENISETAGNLTKLNKPFVENGVNVNANVPRPPYVVPNLGLVDTWKCTCDVCTGNLLQYARGMTSRAYLEEYPSIEDEAEDEAGHDYLIQKDLKPIIRPTEGLESQAQSNNQDKTNVSNRQTSSATTPVENKGKGAAKLRHRRMRGKRSKKKFDSSVWWDSVSTYTTPKWKPPEAQVNVVKPKAPRRRTKPALMRKINLTYSFDKLRLKRNREKLVTETDPSRTDSPDTVNSTAGVAETGGDETGGEQEQDAQSVENLDKTESKTVRTSREDSINMDALFAHRIVYKYKAPENKRHKQIRLPLINGQNGSITATDRSVSDLDETTHRNNDSRLDLKFVGNIESWKNSFVNPNSTREGYFLHDTPENFVEMCIAGLSEYIVRSEVVLTGVGFKRVESLTVNRIPLCKYGESSR